LAVTFAATIAANSAEITGSCSEGNSPELWPNCNS
jgi:hypothetical protein